MIFDPNKAIEALNKNAKEVELKNRFGVGKCAKYVRTAIDEGFGIKDTLNNPQNSIFVKYGGVKHSANLYGDNLEKLGYQLKNHLTLEKDYTRFNLKSYVPKISDIAVIDSAYTKFGHICMFNGSNWVSDFTQNDICGGSKYRKKGTNIKVYSLY